MSTLLGVADYLTEKGSVIWQCTTCYNCYERCPQGTHPVEVITALKNFAYSAGNAPEGITAARESVLEHGTLIASSEAIDKRRKELGLEKAREAPFEDVRKILG